MQTNIKTDVIRSVVVGVGNLGKNQARILSRLDGFELTGVCDVNQEMVKECASELDANAYTDLADLITNEKPQVVAVCSSNNAHATNVMEAVKVHRMD